FARSTWVKVAWQSNATSHTVFWRKTRREKEWRKAEIVRETEYSIVGLEPDSEYEVRVATDPVNLYDLNGKLVEVAPSATSEPILARTRPWEARSWAGFKLWPSV
ncbi:MAG: fibronectin type III domain-containing protein, partial [Armatimonadetes bacterium]|nr:fibronectin type III domain-containing protein [Armatimonadota bacterium]